MRFGTRQLYDKHASQCAGKSLSPWPHLTPRHGPLFTLRLTFRHTYATFALLNDGMDIHTLAIQMGTSIGMIERHYSHLTPRLRKEMLTGRRYELSKEEFEEKVLE